MAREPGAHGSLVGNDMLGHPRGHAAPPLEIHALRRDFFSPPPLRIPCLEPVRGAGAVFPFILETISERPLLPGAQGRAKLFHCASRGRSAPVFAAFSGRVQYDYASSLGSEAHTSALQSLIRF